MEEVTSIFWWGDAPRRATTATAARAATRRARRATAAAAVRAANRRATTAAALVGYLGTNRRHPFICIVAVLSLHHTVYAWAASRTRSHAIFVISYGVHRKIAAVEGAMKAPNGVLVADH